MCHISCVRCQVSGVRCLVSNVMCQVSCVIFFFFFLWTKLWSYSVEGLLSTRTTPSSAIQRSREQPLESNFYFFNGGTICTHWEIQCFLYTGLEKKYTNLNWDISTWIKKTVEEHCGSYCCEDVNIGWLLYLLDGLALFEKDQHALSPPIYKIHLFGNLLLTLLSFFCNGLMFYRLSIF